MRAASVLDYRAMARRRLPRMLFDYIDGGSYAEHTLERNSRDLAAIELRQRVLSGADNPKLETVLFGQPMSMPLVLAPVGLAGMLAPRGEVLAARAARAANVPFCLSTMSICSLDEVADKVAPPWFQLYMLKDRGRLVAMLDRAKALEVPALLFTVDLAVPGSRYRDARSGFSATPSPGHRLRKLADGISHPRWLYDSYVRGRPHMFGNLAGVATTGDGLAGFWEWTRQSFDATASWRDIEWVREHWSGPLILKGILDAEDADTAASLGVEGIVVSNHGGRQLDDVASSIDVLPEIIDVVDGRCKVLIDSGIRSGLDMLKTFALGADACMAGRPWAYGLAARGCPGVAHVVEILRQELIVAMVLTGCRDVRKASQDLLRMPVQGRS